MSTEDVVAAARARALMRATPEVWRALRERAGLTLREVAEVLGVSQMAISRWERGERVARGQNAARYLRLLRLALPREADEEVPE